MMQRFWDWLKSIPIIGWIIVAVGILLGRLLGSRSRRAPCRPPGVVDPDELAREKKRIAGELADDITGIDAAHDRRVEESRSRWDDLRDR